MTNIFIGINEATYIGELALGKGKKDEKEKTGIRNDCYTTRTNKRTRHITLWIMHLFAGGVLQFKTCKLKNDYRQNDTDNHAEVRRNQVCRVEIRAMRLTTKYKDQRQN